jgi:protein-S-isoprenylcysteine O-methyltransferase Ste14
MIAMFAPTDLPGDFIGLCFAIFVGFWAVTAFTTKRTVESRSRWAGPFLLIGFVYMLVRAGFLHAPWMNRLLWPHVLLTGLLGDALALAGLVVMIWARVTIGRNWSGGVVLKENHEMVTSGPYRFVRHPIYSGLLLLVLGWAVWRGSPVGFLALTAMLPLLGLKARAEEQLMIDHFGDAYRSYRARVKALIPYVV